MQQHLVEEDALLPRNGGDGQSDCAGSAIDLKQPGAAALAPTMMGGLRLDGLAAEFVFACHDLIAGTFVHINFG